MFKKLTALLLSLLLCLSLLPGQVLAAGTPDDDPPVIIEEPQDPETPGDPEDPDESGMVVMSNPTPPLPDDDDLPHKY